MNKWTKRRNIFAGTIALALAITAFGAAPANAQESVAPALDSSATEVITLDTLVQAKAELDATGWPKVETQLDSALQTTYSLPDGSEFTLALPSTEEQETLDDGEYEVDFVWGAAGSSQTYFQFNSTDQIAIKNGSAAVVAGVICLAGPAACIVAGVVAAVLATYLNAHGVCKNNGQLKMYFDKPVSAGSYKRSVCVAG